MSRPIAILIADRVVQGPDGKIEVRGGGVAALRFEALPSRSAPLGILIAAEGPLGAEEELDLRISLFDPTGRDLLALQGQATVSRHVPPAGLVPLSWIAVELPPIPFTSAGLHRLVVRISGGEVTAPLLIEGPHGVPSSRGAAPN